MQQTLGEFRCPRCGRVHVRISRADAERAVAAGGDTLDFYQRCYGCGASSSEFVPAAPEDSPDGVTLTPCVIDEAEWGTPQMLDRRSLELHELIAKKLRREPELFAQVRSTLARWLRTVAPNARKYLLDWQEVLDQGIEPALALALDPSERGQVMRSSTPFCGVLSEAERIAFLREFTARHGRPWDAKFEAALASALDRIENDLRACGNTPTISLAVPDDLAKRAQSDAASRGTSLEALVCTLLEGHLSRSTLALPGNYEILLRVALGQLQTDAAAQQLHLDHEDDVFLLLTYCGLPRPRISAAQEAQMRVRLTALASKLAP